MEQLVIAATNETPFVSLNADEGIFKFEGKSYPENVHEFYGNTFTYLEAYLKDPKEKTSLEFSWVYFNTASAKIIVKLIVFLKVLKAQGKTLEIKWFCKPTDDLMQEKGEEFKELLDVEFLIIHN